MNKREQYIEHGMKGLWWLWLLLALCVISVIASPFVWIWHSGSLAWQIFITGFIGFWIFGGIIVWIKRIVTESVDELLEKENLNPEYKSKFQQKMDEMIAKAESSKK